MACFKTTMGCSFLPLMGEGCQSKPGKVQSLVSGDKWSSDGRYVQLTGDSSWLIVDLQAVATYEIEDVDETIFPGSCSSPCDGNPWSKDVARLAFVRNGQIWVSDALGRNAKQVTVDSHSQTRRII